MSVSNIDIVFGLLKELECPVCREECEPPIYMCNNGHNVCSKCQAKIRDCSICRAPKPKSRNLFAEKTVKAIERPCRNADEGCKGVFNYDNMQLHLVDCEDVLYTYDCRVYVNGIKCEWLGNRSGLYIHVDIEHPQDRKTLSCFNEFSDKIQWVPTKNHFENILLSLHGQYFWRSFEFYSSNQLLDIFVSTIGANKTADKYKFHVEFKTKNNEKMLRLSAKSLPCVKSDSWQNKIIRLHETSVIPFVDDDQLNFTVNIAGVGTALNV